MKRESYGRLIMTIGILLMVIAGAVGCSLTTEKTQQEAQKIKKTDVKNENKDGEIMSKNPLTKETTPEFTKAVEKYYESLADKTDYIEGYEGIEVYKKRRSLSGYLSCICQIWNEDKGYIYRSSGAWHFVCGKRRDKRNVSDPHGRIG